MNRILILDIDSCAECPCIHQYLGGAWCVAKDTPMPINWMIFDETPEDVCPLRPLPKKKYADFPNDYEYGYADGYNTCLLEITGETE